MLLTVVVIQGLLPCFRGLNFSWKNQKIEYVLPPCVCTERKHDIKTYEVHAWTKPHTLIKRLTINVTYTWYVYVITIIRNQHSIHTCILAAFPLPASLASKTGSHVVLKIFPGTQHVQADKEASATSAAGRRLGLSCNLSVQFDNDQTTRYYNHESWRDYRHLIFELSEPKILIWKIT